MSTLLGWLGGDGFKTAYFFFQGSPLQFRVCAIFQLSVDVAIVGQRIVYGDKPPPEALPVDEDVEQALRLDSDME
ncbi:SubName: Full=Uncharacterized protein {ECO:0000313/EMBL:CCA73284.1} [Serendipita indica DSM 11827]|nr:SubName: Full=Uncharacterized protein {ECO:0000313/EMBL:CCA73284.1} [Serendipita indica DSM 11827]